MDSLNKVFFMLLTCVVLFGCSDGGGNSTATDEKDHVWKEQTDAINKAKEVEGMMLESAAATRKVIDEESE